MQAADTGVPPVEAFAFALLGASVSVEALEGLAFGGQQPEAREWLVWRLMAGMALVERGYDDGAVRRVLGLEDILLPSSIDRIPKRENHLRAHAAWRELKAQGFYSLAGKRDFREVS